MFNCGNCGFSLDNGASFCGNCGQQVVLPPNVAPAAPVVAQPAVAPAQPQPQPQPQPIPAPAPTPGPQSYQAPQPMAMPQQLGLPPMQPVPMVSNDSRPVVSLILGILSLLTSFLVIGFFTGIAAIILGIASRKSNNSGMAIAGIVMGSIAVAIVALLFTIGFIGGFMDAVSDS